MTRKQPLSTKQKGKVVGMATAGMTHTSIGKRLGIGRTAISAVVAQEAACGTISMATRTGSPRKASVQDLCELQLVLEHNPWMKLAEVKDQLAPLAVVLMNLVSITEWLSRSHSSVTHTRSDGSGLLRSMKVGWSMNGGTSSGPTNRLLRLERTAAR